MQQSLVRQRIFFFSMVLLLLLLTLLLVWPFLNSLLVALAATVIMKPVYQRFIQKGWAYGNERRATVMTLSIFVFALALPILLIAYIVLSQAANLAEKVSTQNIENFIQTATSTIESTTTSLTGAQSYVDEDELISSAKSAIGASSQWLSEAILTFISAIPAFLTSVVIVLVIMWVLLPKFNAPEKKDVADFIPFPPEITQLFFDKMNLMIVAMFKGIFVISFIQGLLMGLLFYITGIPYVALLAILCMILAIVPVVGISLVAWPIGIWLLLNGYIWQGIFVIGGFLVISSIDNLLRARLVPKDAYLNPALVILSVFGGMQLMGFIGLLYGPVIMILLVTSLDVYSKYLLRSDLELLSQEGKIDLEKLGLEDKKGTKAQSTDINFSKNFKHWTKSFFGSNQAKKSK